MYETVIETYEAAVEKACNNFLWHYIIDEDNAVLDQKDGFELKTVLPDSALFSVLGEVYKARGYTQKAVDAFRKAQENEPDNIWLKTVLVELETTVIDAPKYLRRASEVMGKLGFFNKRQEDISDRATEAFSKREDSDSD